MSEAPQLSICIPTFQRAERLQRTLAAWSEVLAECAWRDRIEFCLSDNASADATPDIIAGFQPAGVTVRRHRQRENVGFSRNLHTVARLATGNYLLFAGDDDLPEKLVLLRLSQAFEQGGVVSLFATLPDQPLNPADWERRRASMWIDRAANVVRLLGLFHLTFLGNFIVRRSAYLAHDREEFTASLYPHVAVLLGLLRKERAWWIPEPVLQFNGGGTWNQPLLTAVDLTRVLTDELLLPELDHTLTYDVYRRTVRSLLRAWLNCRSGRMDEPGNPYRSLALLNVIAAYRAAKPWQACAVALWLTGRMLPLPILQRVLGGRPRKVEFQTAV